MESGTLHLPLLPRHGDAARDGGVAAGESRAVHRRVLARAVRRAVRPMSESDVDLRGTVWPGKVADGGHDESRSIARTLHKAGRITLRGEMSYGPSVAVQLAIAANHAGAAVLV